MLGKRIIDGVESGLEQMDGLGLLDSLRQRKGLTAFDGVTVNYAEHKQQQFDILASSMRENINIDRIIKLMAAHQQERV